MKQVSVRRPSGAMIVALTALVVALAGTAMAASTLVNGDSLIKKASLSGDRLRKHTLTGKQIMLSKLGIVPAAIKASTASFATRAGSATSAASLGGHPASAYLLSGKSGEADHVIGTTGEPAFSGTWASLNLSGYAPASFYIDPIGRVHLSGFVQAGTANTRIFTLPLGYRPAGELTFPAGDFGSSTATEEVAVYSNGDVITDGPSTTVTLSGISFRAS